jgi:hypothetical protein
MAVVWGSPQEVRWKYTPGAAPAGRMLGVLVLAVIVAVILTFQFMPEEGLTSFLRRDRWFQPVGHPNSSRPAAPTTNSRPA